MEPPKLFVPPPPPPPVTPFVEQFPEQAGEKSVNSSADYKGLSSSKKKTKKEENGATEEQDTEEKKKSEGRHKTIITKSSLFSTLPAILACLFVGLIVGAG
uniref:Uncharacterized protein n=1 Tax=Parascaris equorum TaxID=6256 RepID=A0A914RNY3_PAREQ